MEAARRANSHATENARVGVIDVGSNSIRLVVYDKASRSPAPVFNERVLCGLGRGLARTNRLSPDGRERALDNLARFSLLARHMGVSRLYILATAAVRDAIDGNTFVEEAERRCKNKISVLSGRDEAQLSALGVLSGAPQADGIMGDLGGGSLELVELKVGHIGQQVTLPLGPLRLIETSDGEPKRSRGLVDDALGALKWLPECKGRSFFAVGGAWRAIARLHIEHSRYPLHVIHHYRVAREEMIEFCRLITGQSRKSLEAMSSNVSRKRLDILPHAALVLHRVLRAAGPTHVVFSAQGIREGQMFSLLSEALKREDPLISAASELALVDSRFAPIGEEMFAWMSPLFPGEDVEIARLRKAACHLGDIAWREHPDYRAEHACLRILRMPLAGIDHPSRGFLALAIYARYSGRAGGDEARGARVLLEQERIELATRIGLAIRVGISVSGGTSSLLRRTSLGLDDERLTLALPDDAAELRGEQIERRVDALANAFNRKGMIAAVAHKAATKR